MRLGDRREGIQTEKYCSELVVSFTKSKKEDTAVLSALGSLHSNVLIM